MSLMHYATNYNKCILSAMQCEWEAGPHATRSSTGLQFMHSCLTACEFAEKLERCANLLSEINRLCLRKPLKTHKYAVFSISTKLPLCFGVSSCDTKVVLHRFRSTWPRTNRNTSFLMSARTRCTLYNTCDAWRVWKHYLSDGGWSEVVL